MFSERQVPLNNTLHSDLASLNETFSRLRTFFFTSAGNENIRVPKHCAMDPSRIKKTRVFQRFENSFFIVRVKFVSFCTYLKKNCMHR